jgi:hypothetical protein
VRLGAPVPAAVMCGVAMCWWCVMGVGHGCAVLRLLFLVLWLAGLMDGRALR